MPDTLTIGGEAVRPGEARTVDLPVPRLYTHDPIAMPVRVVRGREDGPRLFVSAATHGDEINGVEIVRRLIAWRGLEELRGTLLAVPVVNVYGFVSRTRYLPDRRDLNRSFPGSEAGPMANRLAHLFMTEVVAHSTHGVGLHTGAAHRTNLPQIRIDLTDRRAVEMAEAFGAPITVAAGLRARSLREACGQRGVPMVIYEGGEALRFNEAAIRVGLRGVVAVMRHLGMLPAGPPRPRAAAPLTASSSAWTRAPQSGMLAIHTPLGALVRKDDVLGTITGPLGERAVPVCAGASGVVVGRTMLPLVYEGEALFNIARPDEPGDADRRLRLYRTYLNSDPRNDLAGRPPDLDRSGEPEGPAPDTEPLPAAPAGPPPSEPAPEPGEGGLIGDPPFQRPHPAADPEAAPADTPRPPVA